MDRGYIKLWRKVLDSGIIEDGPMCQVFLKALLDAAYKPHEKFVDGQRVHLEPGEFVFGRHKWAEALGLSEKVIRARINTLSKRATIRATKRASKFTVFCLVNWDEYNGFDETPGPAEGPAEGPSEGQQRASRGPHREEGKKGRIEDTPIPPSGGVVDLPLLGAEQDAPHEPKKKAQGVSYSQSFESWWAEYPKRVGKDAAYRSWKKIGSRGDVTVAALLSAIKKQVAEGHFRGSDGNDYIPNPATWLNQGRWADEVGGNGKGQGDWKVNGFGKKVRFDGRDWVDEKGFISEAPGGNDG